MPPIKTCTVCLHSRPISLFRRRSRDSAATAACCRFCHADQERERYRRKRAKVVRQSATRLARAKNADEAARVVAALAHKVKGPIQLADLLVKTLDAAKPGSPAQARVLLALLNLNNLVKVPSLQEKVDRMDNEELKAHLERLRRRGIMYDKFGRKRSADEQLQREAELEVKEEQVRQWTSERPYDCGVPLHERF